MKERITRLTRLGRREEGAAAVEFALFGPLLFLVVTGLFYLLILMAAQLSLGYATNVGVRYAAIPTSPGVYPSASEVVTEATQATPFFSSSSCTPTLANAAGPNQPLTLTLDCSFPNPAGQAYNAIKNALYGGGSTSSSIELTATAQSRRE